MSWEKFIVLESAEEIDKAHEQLVKTISLSLGDELIKNIGYPGGTRLNANIFANNKYWFGAYDDNYPDTKSPRHLNWFGLLTTTPSVHITVEINTPYKGINRRVAGFFARDSETGFVYLMHTGAVGGGKKGVGKKDFLKYINPKLTLCGINSSKKSREGIIVMPILGDTAVQGLVDYINKIVAFKKAVREGAI